MTMYFWSFYFLAKLGLHAMGRFDFAPWWNLALLALVIWPLTGSLRLLRALIAVPAGLLLLYHDSHLPPLARALEAWQDLSTFTWQYRLELIGRFISVQDLAGLLIAALLYVLLSLKLRMSTFAVIGVAMVPLLGVLDLKAPATNAPASVSQSGQLAPAPASLRPEAVLEQYYETEQGRRTVFPSVMPQGLSFDLVILNVCSLSWDDLSHSGYGPAVLDSRFDAVFSRFNSAASYSGPAAIRILRSSCGASSHRDLYQPVADSCLLFPQLERLGYSTVIMANHNGQFGNYLDNLRRYGRTSSPLIPLPGGEGELQQFDGTPMYRDRRMLDQWLQRRPEGDAGPQALFYNSATLHDGNRVKAHAALNSDENYPIRLRMFLDDLDAFLGALEQSGRPTVVLMVPEHGGARRGDDWQISGLRELPTPSITTVPMALRLVGWPRRDEAVRIDDPVSYLAMSELINRLVLNDPYSAQALELEDYVLDLPQSRFVAENGDIVVMHDGREYLLRGPDGRWSPLTVGLGDY